MTTQEVELESDKRNIKHTPLSKPHPHPISPHLADDRADGVDAPERPVPLVAAVAAHGVGDGRAHDPVVLLLRVAVRPAAGCGGGGGSGIHIDEDL